VSEQDDSQCAFNWQSATSGESAGESGSRHYWESLRLPVDVEIARRFLFSQPVPVMNLEELSKRFQIPFDGLLGQRILNQFRSVRIDHKAHVIELDISLAVHCRCPGDLANRGDSDSNTSWRRSSITNCNPFSIMLQLPGTSF